jgi:Uma2 family endonuclease
MAASAIRCALRSVHGTRGNEMAQTVVVDPLPQPAGSGRLRMTFEQFLDWLDEDTHAEWVNGEVVMHSPVSFPHQRVRGLLYRLVAGFVERGDLGEIADDPFLMRLETVGACRAPDILYVAKENLARLKRTMLEGPADLAVEIVSPGSRGVDRGDKHYEYERGGVREYWLIDPERTVAEFYILGADGRYALAPTPDGVFHSEVLPGFWLRVEWLWQDPLPTEAEILRAWGTN